MNNVIKDARHLKKGVVYRSKYGLKMTFDHRGRSPQHKGCIYYMSPVLDDGSTKPAIPYGTFAIKNMELRPVSNLSDLSLDK
jgi:hypothetical protein